MRQWCAHCGSMIVSIPSIGDPSCNISAVTVGGRRGCAPARRSSSADQLFRSGRRLHTRRMRACTQDHRGTRATFPPDIAFSATISAERPWDDAATGPAPDTEADEKVFPAGPSCGSSAGTLRGRTRGSAGMARSAHAPTPARSDQTAIQRRSAARSRASIALPGSFKRPSRSCSSHAPAHAASTAGIRAGPAAAT